jgi:glycosyltransferase involved in cell wall biosynthesis
MKKILIITYYWPPSGGSGVQRWMYFSKYLPEFGYEPIVLTVSEKKASYKHTDISFLENVKGIETYKTNTLEPLKLYSLITTGDKTAGIPSGHITTGKRSFFKKLSTYVRGNLFIPDARIGWNRYALKKARKIISEQKIDIIVTTGPPHSTHLIGLELQKEFSIKWIADLRDPWTDIYYNKILNRTDKTEKIDKSLEQQVLNKADVVLTVGFKLKELLQKKVVNNHDKFHHIYNGYDSFLMQKIPVETQSYFEITFIGILTLAQPYASIIKIISKFLEEIPDANIKICLAGNIQNDILNELTDKFTSSKILHQGYVQHAEAIRLMKRSQLLINLLADMAESQILISGKQMEYIATGNPILCIGNTKGESALILDDIENARIYEKEQINESVAFLIETYNKWHAGISCVQNTKTESIINKSRYETTRQLSQLINQI